MGDGFATNDLGGRLNVVGGPKSNQRVSSKTHTFCLFKRIQNPISELRGLIHAFAAAAAIERVAAAAAPAPRRLGARTVSGGGGELGNNCNQR